MDTVKSKDDEERAGHEQDSNSQYDKHEALMGKTQNKKKTVISSLVLVIEKLINNAKQTQQHISTKTY